MECCEVKIDDPAEIYVRYKSEWDSESESGSGSKGGYVKGSIKVPRPKKDIYMKLSVCSPSHVRYDFKINLI